MQFKAITAPAGIESPSETVARLELMKLAQE